MFLKSCCVTVVALVVSTLAVLVGSNPNMVKEVERGWSVAE